MEAIIKHKRIIIIALVVVLLLVVFLDKLPFNNSEVRNDAEAVAGEFLQNMLDGDAEKCAELMCDDLIAMSEYETKKLFINAFDKKLDSLIETYKDKYGKLWTYEISVIDSFEYTPEYYAYEGDEELVKIVLEIGHKGGGLFKDKEGTDEFEVVMGNIDGEWLVYDFPFLTQGLFCENHVFPLNPLFHKAL